MAAHRPRAQRRWPLPMPLIAVGAALVLLTLAWVDGGEQPLRPIAQVVDLPEPQR